MLVWGKLLFKSQTCQEFLHNPSWLANTSIINQHNENLCSAACHIAGLYCRSSYWRNGEKITNGCYKYSLLVTLFFFLHGLLGKLMNSETSQLLPSYWCQISKSGLATSPARVWLWIHGKPLFPVSSGMSRVVVQPWLSIAGYPPSHGQVQISLSASSSAHSAVLGFPATIAC